MGAHMERLMKRMGLTVFGYNNDYAWQQYVLKQLVSDLRSHWPMLCAGEIIWQAASLHVYPRHFHLLREAASDPELVAMWNVCRRRSAKRRGKAQRR